MSFLLGCVWVVDLGLCLIMGEFCIAVCRFPLVAVSTGRVGLIWVLEDRNNGCVILLGFLCFLGHRVWGVVI